jgi:ABC-type polar amino acid transport system ATPase subunit
MKICKIYIKGYQQFQDVILDFTHPETGEPLDKICLIGSNGTGKTTLLNIVKDSLQRLSSPYSSRRNSFLAENPVLTDSLIIVEYFDNGSYFTDFFHFYTDKHGMVNEMSFGRLSKSRVFDANIFHALSTIELTLDYFSKTKDDSQNLPYTVDNQYFLKIFSTFECKTNGYATIEDVPKTTVNEAIKLFDNLPNEAIVSPDTVNDFWKLLVFNLKKREDDRRIFEETDENMQRIKADLVKEFNGKNPNVLEELATIWDKILDKAGLFFNYKVKSPVQLYENLHAYVCLKDTNTVIPFSKLSSGIQDYIFRVGHIFAMYFNRKIDRGVLLVDEPENSLFPTFVLDLLNTYKQITTDKRGENNTQMIFATHNPMFANQFEDYERVILSWNDDNSVTATTGVSPIGDDPNDILVNDFQSEIFNEAGMKKWNEYVELKKKLIRANDSAEKEQLRRQINKIGRLYNYAE